jgi:hypothetical protein
MQVPLRYKLFNWLIRQFYLWGYFRVWPLLLPFAPFQVFPIATGVIEGACRHLVKDRMAITGARWRLRSAEAVLKLRSLHSSGDRETYWDFHKAQELKRNHTSRLTNCPLQKTA